MDIDSNRYPYTATPRLYSYNVSTSVEYRPSPKAFTRALGLGAARKLSGHPGRSVANAHATDGRRRHRRAPAPPQPTSIGQLSVDV
eukprot:scaffold180_cov134-Isochrysis_galbana.AAC.8